MSERSRRDLLTGWLDLFGVGPSAKGRRGPDPKTALRPPGALEPDDAFVAACTGCGDCATACPADSIVMIGRDPDPPIPVIDPGRKPCRMCEDLPCIAACPDAALVDPGGLLLVRMGVARVDPRRCVTFRGEICTLCFKACPFPNQAIMLIGTRPLVSNTCCTGCGLCLDACPEAGAISITPERRLVPGLRVPQEEYQAG